MEPVKVILEGTPQVLSAFTHSIFSLAKRRINFKCNRGYTSQIDSIREASKKIRQKDKDAQDRGEYRDFGEQEKDLQSIQEAQRNEERF